MAKTRSIAAHARTDSNPGDLVGTMVVGTVAVGGRDGSVVGSGVGGMVTVVWAVGGAVVTIVVFAVTGMEAGTVVEAVRVLTPMRGLLC